MKRILFTLLVIVSSGAFAANDVATLTLNGSIGDVIEIEVSLDGATWSSNETNNFNLATAGESDKLVGKLRWRTNMSGYDIAVVSANAWQLTRDVTNFLAYTVKVGSDVSTTGALALTGLTALSSTIYTERDVSISYGSAAALPAGTYTDTLTFTITAP